LATPARAFGPMGWGPMQWRDEGTPAPRLRVAVVSDDPCAEVDASVRDPLRALAGFLREKGFAVSETVRPVSSAESWEVYIHLLRSATGAMLGDADYAAAVAQAKLQPKGAAPAAGREMSASEFATWHWHANTLSHREWVHYDQRRAALRRQWAAFFEQWDVLICPVATTAAFAHNPNGQRWERMLNVNGREQPTTQQLFWAGYPGLVGLPATAVPLGLSAEGLPVGAQIIGPAFADPVCLRLARWLEDHYRRFVAPADLQ
jgi:amidase